MCEVSASKRFAAYLPYSMFILAIVSLAFEKPLQSVEEFDFLKANPSDWLCEGEVAVALLVCANLNQWHHSVVTERCICIAV